MVPKCLGDPGHGRGESVGAMMAAHQQWMVHAGSLALREKIMRTDANELPLDELASTEINLEHCQYETRDA